MRGAADSLIASLAPAATVATGRLKLDSTPSGMIVMLDGQKIGVTPIDRDIAVGEHAIVLVDGGTQVGERQVKILSGATVEVTVPVVYPPTNPKYRPPPDPSRVPPVLCWVGGGLLLGGSGVMFYLGQQGGPDHPDDKYRYRGATPTGVGLAAAGAAAIGVGIWLWVHRRVPHPGHDRLQGAGQRKLLSDAPRGPGLWPRARSVWSPHVRGSDAGM